MSTLTRLLHAPRRLFLGWWVVGGSILLQTLMAGLFMQAYGTYVAVWQADFGWSATVFATAFALQRGLIAILSPFQGWLLDRFGPRLVIRVGLVIAALGFMLLSQVETVIGFYLAFSVLAMGVALAGFLSLTSTVVNWFERRRSSALALMQIGISIGGFAVPIVAWALTTYGWRPTAIASAVLLLVAGFPVTWMIRSTPEDYGLHPDGDEPPLEVGSELDRDTPEASASELVGHPSARRDYSTSEALQTRAFWLIALGHATAVSVVAAVTVHIVVHLNEGVGLSLQFAATIIAILTGAALVGQIVGGVLGDRFDKRHIATIAMIGHAIALLMVAYGHTVPWVLAFAGLHGLSWGMRGPLMQAMRADYFGRSSFAKIMGVSVTLVMMGQIIGPVLVGVLADATGSYSSGFALLAGAVGLGSLCFLFLSPPPQLRIARAEPPQPPPA